MQTDSQRERERERESGRTWPTDRKYDIFMLRKWTNVYLHIIAVVLCKNYLPLRIRRNVLHTMYAHRPI